MKRLNWRGLSKAPQAEGEEGETRVLEAFVKSAGLSKDLHSVQWPSKGCPI